MRIRRAETKSSTSSGRHDCLNPQSAIGNPQSGVTLLELLIVLTIIAVAGGVVLPSVTSGLDNLRLKTTAERLGSTFRYARERAVRQQATCQVTVDPERRVVELEDLRFGDGRPAEAPSRSWELPQEIALNTDRPRVFIFPPDGSVPQIGLRLTNGRGRSAIVEFDVLSALPRVRVD